MTLSISVIVPTLNAENEIGVLLAGLMRQTVMPEEILVIDSSSDDNTERIVSGFSGLNSKCSVRFFSIERTEFNHGGTRRLAVSKTRGDIVVLMTQDAMPAVTNLLECLLAPFDDPSVAIVSGRQVAKPEATRSEQLIREYNYPEKSHIYSASDLSAYGIKVYYTSDVCCAYRRTAYEAVGGFPEVCNTSEDMYVAIRAIKAGWKIAYSAGACVSHSHNLTLRQQYQRNFQIGYFLESQANELAGISEVGKGLELVRYVTRSLLAEGEMKQLIAFGLDCVVRLLGNKMGRYRFRQSGNSSSVSSRETEC